MQYGQPITPPFLSPLDTLNAITFPSEPCHSHPSHQTPYVITLLHPTALHFCSDSHHSTQLYRMFALPFPRVRQPYRTEIFHPPGRNNEQLPCSRSNLRETLCIIPKFIKNWTYDDIDLLSYHLTRLFISRKVLERSR